MTLNEEPWMNVGMPPELTIIGVGGCGKRLVSKLYEHDWFIKHYLYNKEKSLEIYTIDTATDEQNDDENRTQKFIQKISDIRNTQPSVFLGPITCQHISLPKLVNIFSIAQLANEEVCHSVKTMANSMCADAWWINDPKNGMPLSNLQALATNFADGIGQGVLRRRAISKAFFYKAISGGANFPSFTSPTRTYALIVGLGGGTGSGMFLDLAKYIVRFNAEGQGDIILFAILPSSKEGEKEKLNAAIALSELEYLNIHSKGAINRVIVSSLEPTAYTGTMETEELKDFDSAFAYTFFNTLYMNQTAAYQLADARNKYAGMILANSHVIEYPVEKLRNLSDDFSKLLQSFGEISHTQNSLLKKTETYMNTSLEKYSCAFADASIGANITIDDFRLYKLEIERVKNIWEHPILQILEFDTPKIIQDCIANNLNGVNFADIGTFADLNEYVTNLSQILAMNQGPTGNPEDNNLYEQIKSYLGTIEAAMRVHTTALRIREGAASAALREIIHGNVQTGPCDHMVQARIKTLNAELTENTKLKETTQISIKEQETQCSEKERQITEDADASIIQKTNEYNQIEQQKTDLKEKLDTQVNIAEQKISAYLTLKNSSQNWINIESAFVTEFNELQKKLKQKLAAAQEKSAHPITADIWDRTFPLVLLKQELGRVKTTVGIDAFADFADRMSEYYRKRYLHILSQKTGFLGKRRFSELETPDVYKNECATLEDLLKRHTACRNGIISISTDPEFEISINESFLRSTYESRMGISITEILNVFANEPFSIARSDYDGIKLKLRSIDDPTEFSQYLNTAVFSLVDKRKRYSDLMSNSETERTNLGTKRDKDIAILKSGTKDAIDRLEMDIKRIDGEITEAKLTVEFLESVHLFILSASEGLRAYDGVVKKFTAQDTQLRGHASSGRANSGGIYRTRFEDLNQAVLPIIRNQDAPSLASFDHGNADGAAELNKLFNLTTGSYKNLINESMLGIETFSIPYKDNTGSWNFASASMVIAAPSKTFTGRFEAQDTNWDLCNTIRQKLQPTKPNGIYISKQNCAKPWEIALTFIASAGYYDLLSSIAQQNKYWEIYQNGKNNYLHHVLFMDKGIYITRNDRFALTEAARLANDTAIPINIEDADIDTKNDLLNRGYGALRQLDALYTAKCISNNAEKRKELLDKFTASFKPLADNGEQHVD